MENIVSKFLHTRMRVDDLDRTVDFYQKVFGLKVSRRHESPRGSKLVFLSVPNSEEAELLGMCPSVDSSDEFAEETLDGFQASGRLHKELFHKGG